MRTPGAKSAYGRRSRSAIRRETPSISASSCGIDDELAAGGGGEELDRAVVVRRTEPAGDHEQVGVEPFVERGPQLVGTVADDRDPCRLETEPDELACQERPVQVAAVAADQLAPGDEDDRARTAQVASRTGRKR